MWCPLSQSRTHYFHGGELIVKLAMELSLHFCRNWPIPTCNWCYSAYIYQDVMHKRLKRKINPYFWGSAPPLYRMQKGKKLTSNWLHLCKVACSLRAFVSSVIRGSHCKKQVTQPGPETCGDSGPRTRQTDLMKSQMGFFASRHFIDTTNIVSIFGTCHVPRVW